MNPDKLFDYLDGRLSPFEREQLEEQLVHDSELQRELSMARRIHGRMTGESREVLIEDGLDQTDRGRKIVLRIAVAFIVLVLLNVVVGLYAIAFVEKKRNAAPAGNQNRRQLELALQKAAANALPTPSLDVDEIKFVVPRKQRDQIIAKITSAAKQSGGSAAKNLSNENGTLIFAEVPPEHVNEFREALGKLGAILPPSTTPPDPGSKAILQIRVVESAK